MFVPDVGAIEHAGASRSPADQGNESGPANHHSFMQSKAAHSNRRTLYANFARDYGQPIS
jgi:hypothetical protein